MRFYLLKGSRVALSLVVVFWMAGAGCLLGCENMVAKATAAQPEEASALTIVASGDACASRRSHDCCAGKAKKSSRNANVESQLSTSGMRAELSEAPTSMRDCPLAVNATAALSKTNHDQTSSASLATRTSWTVPNVNEQTSPLSPPLLLPNRGHTYLRCCSFLI